MSSRLFFIFISVLLLSQTALTENFVFGEIAEFNQRSNVLPVPSDSYEGVRKQSTNGNETLGDLTQSDQTSQSSISNDSTSISRKNQVLEPGKDYLVFAKNDRRSEIVELFREKEFHIKKIYPNINAFRISVAAETAIANSPHYKIYDVSNTRVRLSSLSDGISLFGTADYSPIDVETVWNKGFNGSGVVIGLLDTKVVYSGVLEGKQFLTKVFGEGDDSNPYNLHATRVASLMVGYDNSTQQPFGVAYGAKIANAQLGVDSNGYLVGDVFQAMDWLGGIPEVDIINFSFGGPNIADNDPIEAAAEALVALGKLVIASVGNDGSSKWYKIGTPSSSPELIGVGASSGSSSIAAFSSGGPTTFFEPKPDVVAPGQNVEVRPGETGSGTSYAAPIVAGVAALLTQYLKNKTIAKFQPLVKSSILKGAHPIANDQRIEGMGIVNASKSLEILGTLLNESQSDPELVAVQPYSAPLNTMREIATSTRFVQRIFVTSTNLDDLQPKVEGNLSDYASVELFRKGLITSTYQLIVTAPEFATFLTGKVSFSLGTINDSLTIELNVTDYWKGIALIDLKHTNWDDLGADLPNGYNLGEFFNLLKEEEIFAELFQVGDLSKLDLAKYRFIMIPDGFDYVPPEDEPYVGTLELSDAELNALSNYVREGGALILDFVGPTSNGGTDPLKIDDLLAAFGLTLSDDLASQAMAAAKIVNSTSANFKTSAITHLGTSIAHAGLTTFPIARLENGNVVATLTQTGNFGKVFVVTSNFPFDNSGIKDGYTIGKNREFVRTILEQVLITSSIFVENVEIFSNSTFSIRVRSESPVFVKPGQDALVALTQEGSNKYSGLVSIPTAPSTITVFNTERNYVQWNLSTSFLDFPEITIPTTTISPGAWNTIAVLQYPDSPPTNLFYIASATLDDEQLPLKVEYVTADTLYLRLSPQVSDLVLEKQEPLIFLSILNSQWEAKTVVVTANGTSFTPSDLSPGSTSSPKKAFVLIDYWYLFLFTILITATIFVARKKNID